MGDGAVLCCDNDPERGWEEGVQGALWVRWGGGAAGTLFQSPDLMEEDHGGYRTLWVWRLSVFIEAECLSFQKEEKHSFSDSTHAQSLSPVRLSVAPWAVACQAPLSMEFPRQEYWSGLPCPPGELPNPGITPASPALQADPLPTEPPGKPQTQRRRWLKQWTHLDLMRALGPRQIFSGCCLSQSERWDLRRWDMKRNWKMVSEGWYP